MGPNPMPDVRAAERGFPKLWDAFAGLDMGFVFLDPSSSWCVFVLVIFIVMRRRLGR